MEDSASSLYVPGTIFSSLFAANTPAPSVSKKSKKKSLSKDEAEKKPENQSTRATATADDSLFSNTQASLKATVIIASRTSSKRTKSNENGAKDAKKKTKKQDGGAAREDMSDREDSDEPVSDVDADDDDDNDSEAEKQVQEDAEKNSRTVFVGNVPIKAFLTEEDVAKPNAALKKLEKALRKQFSQYGKIESIRLRSLGLKSVKVPSGSDFHVVRKVAVLKGSLDDRLDTCNAFVVFEHAETVAEAVEKADNQVFHGNHLRVDSLKEPKGRVFDRKRSVFVGNLVFEASEEECRAHFASKLGDEAVKAVRIVRDPSTNLGRGFGYVLLNDRSTVPKAIELLNDTKLRTRSIRVTKCERPGEKDGDSRKRTNKDAAGPPSKKPRREFAGKEASDPTETPGAKSRRKNATLAQKAANKPKAEKKPKQKAMKKQPMAAKNKMRKEGKD